MLFLLGAKITTDQAVLNEEFLMHSERAHTDGVENYSEVYLYLLGAKITV